MTMGVITCGDFSALLVAERPTTYEITCKHLPGWAERITGPESVASDAIIRLQAEFRNTWGDETK